MIDAIPRYEELMITRYVRSDDIELFKTYGAYVENYYVPAALMPLSLKRIPFHFG
jgi:hypothetical protein